MPPENYKFDNSFRGGDISLIAGTDEAGRGPLAGPVVAAAVLFPPDIYINGIGDSKKLSHQKREELFTEIIKYALSFAFTVISPEKIDEINILQASLRAMSESLRKLTHRPDYILIDGNRAFPYDIPALPIVKGDSKSMAIGAASIIAKVIRDRIMTALADEYPVYNWKSNKGYPTRDHIEAIRQHGITPHHRLSFLNNILEGRQYELRLN